MDVQKEKMKKPFPYEDFVQKSVENHLRKMGCKIILKDKRKKKTRGPGIDIRAYKLTKTKNYSSGYNVECKGKTKSIYVTSNEVFGQIFKRMNEKVYSAENYVIAIPDMPDFVKEFKKIPKKVFQVLSSKLNLKVWLVNKHGKVTKYEKTD